MNTAATAIDKQAEGQKHALAEGSQARGDANLMRPQNSQECTIQERSGQERGDDRRRLAVSIGEPRVQRGQPHLGAVPDQEEEKRSFDPGGMKASRRTDQVRQGQCRGRIAPIRGGNRQHEVAQQGQCDPDRANQQILPRRLERPVVAVEVDQRRTGQRCGLDADPKQAEVLAHGHKRHRRQEQQQTTCENRFRLVAEKEVLFDVDVPRMPLAAKVADAVHGGCQE